MLYYMPDHIASAAHFGAIVRDLIDAGMSQSEIAAAALVAQSEVSRLLNGKRRRVTYETGVRLVDLHRAKVPAKALERPPTNAAPVKATRASTNANWRRSDAGIEAKGRELNIPPRT